MARETMKLVFKVILLSRSVQINSTPVKSSTLDSSCINIMTCVALNLLKVLVPTSNVHFNFAEEARLVEKR